MALIGTIRKNGWLLIVIMTLALGGFMMMDAESCNQRYSAAEVNSLGTVGDTEIKRSEFDNYEQLVYSGPQANSYQVRTQAWDYFVERAIVEKEAKAMGIGVGKEELIDLQFGLNISPVVAERFKGADGQPNRATLSSIKNAIETGQFTEPKNRDYWAVQEREVIKTRLQEKLTTAISKGMYAPKWQAEMAFKENNQRRDFCTVRIPFDKVKDEEVKVGDSDYEAYLKQNPGVYDQTEESRIVSYVAFDVAPTSADSATARESVAKLIEGFRNAKSDSVYVVANGGSFLNQFMPKDKFPASFADSVMTSPLGSIIGPVYDAGDWRIIKIVGRKVLPDSVRARHILLREATPENGGRADSLMALLRSGKLRFDSLAIQMSQDVGSGKKGGDLGWFANGAMVAEFNEVCFLTGEQGKLYKVATQFGWHIIEITGKKFIKNESSVKVGVLSRRIEPSKTTQQTMKDKAVALVQQAKNITDLETLAKQQNILMQNTMPLKINEYNLGVAIGSGDDAREVVRWAFDENNKVGSVSKEVFAFRDPQGGYFDSKYLVAAVKSITPEGKATVATLKATPDAQTRVKNLKKAEAIKSKIQSPGDLSALAAQWEGRVDTSRNSSFLQTNGEPRVSGTLSSLETGKVSGPIVGNGGVMFIQPLTEKTQPPVPADLTMFKRQLASQSTSALRVGLMKSLKVQHKVKDNRFRFW
ncbi:MAG: peptidylprolyl isomerase [Saprospiraceae bacterium]